MTNITMILADNQGFKYLKGDKVVLNGTTGRAYGQYQHSNALSINLNGVAKEIWSNGWCPIVKVIKRNDEYIGLIANELIPCKMYVGTVVKVNCNIKTV